MFVRITIGARYKLYRYKIYIYKTTNRMTEQTRQRLPSIGYRLLWIYNDRSVGREPYAQHTTGIAELNYNMDRPENTETLVRKRTRIVA